MTARTVISVACAIVTAGLTAQAREPKPADVAVYMEGAGDMSDDLLHGAKYITQWMFGHIGVRLEWRDGRPGGSTDIGGAVVIHVRLIADDPAFPPEALAYARPYSDGTDSITVMYDRIIRRVAERSWHGPILAHVLAHEIGHVLQGVSRHSETGVMKAHWRFEDYLAMKRQPMEFTRLDVELIKRGMDVRKTSAGNLLAQAR